jgi:hypothetical protein
MEPAAGGAVVRRARAELVIPTRRGFLAVRVREEGFRLCKPCDECGPGKRGCAVEEVGFTRGWLEEVQGTGRIGFGPFPAEEDCASGRPIKIDDFGLDPSFSVRLLGPYVFASFVSYLQECGGVRAVNTPHFVTYDAERDMALDPLRPPAPARERLEKQAYDAIVKDYGGDPDCLLGRRTPALFSASFAYDTTAELHGRYAWSHPAITYLCAKDILYWVPSLSVIKALHDPALPAEVEPWRRPPAWLTGYVRAHARNLYGMSPLPAELDRARAIAAFESPLPKGTSHLGPAPDDP